MENLELVEYRLPRRGAVEASSARVVVDSARREPACHFHWPDAQSLSATLPSMSVTDDSTVSSTLRRLTGGSGAAEDGSADAGSESILYVVASCRVASD